MASATFGPPPSPGIGLDAVAGHASARAFLAARVRARALPHALLFSGPRGVGKRTLAQALAADHFCATGRGCASCRDCGALLRGHHAALRTVSIPEGKSAIPIDAIQQLSHELSLRPLDERGRVVLIAGADRMTAPAQDALLKTLEEPPPGNVLVLTSVRPDALLPTIRSRCQRFALAPLSDREVESVAERLGLKLAVPVAVAGGCPGALVELVDPAFEKLRRGVAALLADARGGDDLARWITLLHHDGHDGGHDGHEGPTRPAKEVETAELRARARRLLSIVASLVRDAVVLRASHGAGTIRNADQLERLRAIAVRPEWADASAALGRLARAHDRLEGNVDPASALYCALHPAADEAAQASES